MQLRGRSPSPQRNSGSQAALSPTPSSPAAPTATTTSASPIAQPAAAAAAVAPPSASAAVNAPYASVAEPVAPAAAVAATASSGTSAQRRTQQQRAYSSLDPSAVAGAEALAAPSSAAALTIRQLVTDEPPVQPQPTIAQRPPQSPQPQQAPCRVDRAPCSHSRPQLWSCRRCCFRHHPRIVTAPPPAAQSAIEPPPPPVDAGYPVAGTAAAAGGPVAAPAAVTPASSAPVAPSWIERFVVTLQKYTRRWLARRRVAFAGELQGMRARASVERAVVNGERSACETLMLLRDLFASRLLDASDAALPGFSRAEANAIFGLVSPLLSAHQSLWSELHRRRVAPAVVSFAGSTKHIVRSPCFVSCTWLSHILRVSVLNRKHCVRCMGSMHTASSPGRRRSHVQWHAYRSWRALCGHSSARINAGAAHSTRCSHSR